MSDLSTIRTCPDCRGRCGWHRAPHERESYEYVPVSGSGTSQTGLRKIKLPDWEPCGLCGGEGKVECRPVREKPGRMEK